MEVLNLDQARHFLREKPIRVNVIDRPRLTCELVCMEPDQKEERQTFDVSDNLYVVVEGRCVIRTGVSEHELGVHDALVVPPGVEHWITNPGPERVTIMAFVAPKPARASEVRFPRQQRDFSAPRPRPVFRPRFEPAEDAVAHLNDEIPTDIDDEEMNDDEAEVAALIAELEAEDSDEEETGEANESPSAGERSFPERGGFNRDNRDFGNRPPSGPRREFSGGHENRGPRRDFAPRPFTDRPGPSGGGPRRNFGDRPPYGGGGGAPRRDFNDRTAGGEGGPRRSFGDRPAYGGGGGGGPRRNFGDRPPYGGGGGGGPRRSFGDRPPYGGGGGGPRRDFNDRPTGGEGGQRREFNDRSGGEERRDFRPGGGGRPDFPNQYGRPRSGGGEGRPPYQQSRGPRPFGNRPPPRRGFEGAEGGEDRGNRRPPVSRDFYPRKANQTGGSKEFTPRPGGRSGAPSNRGGFSGAGRGGRPGGPPPRGGRPTGGGARSNRPNPGRNARPGPGRNGPRTSGRRPGS